MLDNTRKPIYKHDFLRESEIARMKPLFESAFAKKLNEEGASARRKQVLNEKINFAATQYANRVRISNNMGTHPLFEDSKIFGAVLPDTQKLFESVSTPSNIIGMGNVVNPDPSYAHTGGQWNPAYKAGSGDIPSYVFGLQSQLAIHCEGFDLVPTIAVDTPKVTIQYVDDVYGGGILDDSTNLPSFLDVTNKLFTAEWLNNAKIQRGVTKFVFASNDDSKAVEVIFMVGSMINAGVTIKVESTGKVVAGVYQKTNEWSVKAVESAMTNNGKLYYTDTTGVAKTENFTTEVKFGFTSAIRNPLTEASTNNLKDEGMTRAQHEKGPSFKLNVVSMDKQIEMVGFEFEADTTNIQIRDFAAQGINVIARLYNGVQNQLIQSIDNVILKRLYRLGVEHAYNTKMSQGIDHSLYIANPAKTSLRYDNIKNQTFEFKNMIGTDVRTEMGEIKNIMQSAAYENQTTHAERLYSRILLVSEYMAQQNRIGAPDWILLSGELAATVKKHSTYVTRPTANTLANKPELHYTGTIFETISVYKNPKTNFNDPRVLLGRRGDDTDSGCKFLAYDLASSRQTIAEQTMAEKIRVWSRFNLVEVGFYPELNYFTFVAVNEYGWS